MASTAQKVGTDILGGDMAGMLSEIVGYNNEFNSAQALQQMNFQRQQNALAMDFNAQEAQKNRDWQKMMSDSAHQREVADLIKAGLNPVLSASGGNGASVGSGAQASGVTSSGAKAEADQSLVSGLVGLVSSAMSYNASVAAASINSAAQVQAAQIAADSAWDRLQAQQLFDIENPSNFIQWLNTNGKTLIELMSGNGTSDGTILGRLYNMIKGNSGWNKNQTGVMSVEDQLYYWYWTKIKKYSELKNGYVYTKSGNVKRIATGSVGR